MLDAAAPTRRFNLRIQTYETHNQFLTDLGHLPINSLSKFQESTDSARVVYSLDSPATLLVKSGLQALF